MLLATASSQKKTARVGARCLQLTLKVFTEQQTHDKCRTLSPRRQSNSAAGASPSLIQGLCGRGGRTRRAPTSGVLLHREPVVMRSASHCGSIRHQKKAFFRAIRKQPECCFVRVVAPYPALALPRIARGTVVLFSVCRFRYRNCPRKQRSHEILETQLRHWLLIPPSRPALRV